MPKQRTRTLFLFFLALGVMSLAGCQFLSGNKPAIPPTSIAATKVTLKPWQETLQTVGSLTASQGIVIRPETSGRVTAVYFRSGENVKAGDPLIQLNPTLLQAKLDAAKAQTQLSKADYERAATLYKQKVFSKADLDKALANYQANQALQAEAQAALDQTLIRAPFAGRLGLRDVELGDYVTTSTAMTNLNALNPLRVDFNIPGSDAEKVQIGAKVLVHSASHPNQTFVAKVYATDSQIDTNTRSLSVRAELNNPQQQLLPGAFVDVTLDVTQMQKFATVPETAVAQDEKGSYVYRIIQHRAVRTPVTVIFQKKGFCAIGNGLKPGDEIISAGGFKVFNHAPVIVGK